jgi:hypothetical protein
VAGIAELADDQCVERAAEACRNLVRDRDPAARDRVDGGPLVAEVGKLGPQQAAGLTAVGERG